MIESQYRIVFSHDGQADFLLAPGDILMGEPEVKTTQPADTYTPIGAAWGESAARGGAMTTMTWSVVLQHASHAAMRNYLAWAAASFPGNVSGSLRVATDAGVMWEIEAVTCMTSATALRIPCSGFQTVTSVSVQGGKINLMDGGTFVLPPPDPLIFRTTEANGPNGIEKWWEAGFVVCDEMGLTGSAATGWTDVQKVLRLTLERSENLTAWTHGDWLDCAGSPVANGDGTHTYWSRSPLPMDSKIKTGVVVFNGGVYPDDRNNPLTALTLAGVVQALPGFPYTMPTDAARMQADLRAYGWAGATVTANSATDWIITILGVNMSVYSSDHKVYWPGYLTADMFGALTNTSDGLLAFGNWQNSAGVRTYVDKQFARQGLTLISP